MQLDNWDDLKFVLAMKRHGTMSAAARHLNTNVATVSRRIERMSQALRVPLFEKRGATFVATKAADDLAAVAERLDQTLKRQIANIRTGHGDERVPLEFSAPPAVHRHFVPPRARELALRLPHVLLTLTDKVIAHGLGGADIQVRIGRPDGGRLKARKFRDCTLRVYYRRDRPLDGEWIGLAHRYDEADMLRDIHPKAAALPRYRVESMPVALDLSRETGLATLLPDFLVLPEHGLVVADLPGNAIPYELWIAYHETRHGDSTLRAVVDWLHEPMQHGLSDGLSHYAIPALHERR